MFCCQPQSCSVAHHNHVLLPTTIPSLDDLSGKIVRVLDTFRSYVQDLGFRLDSSRTDLNLKLTGGLAVIHATPLMSFPVCPIPPVCHMPSNPSCVDAWSQHSSLLAKAKYSMGWLHPPLLVPSQRPLLLNHFFVMQVTPLGPASHPTIPNFCIPPIGCLLGTMVNVIRSSQPFVPPHYIDIHLAFLCSLLSHLFW